FRIAPRRGIDQITKIIEQARIRLARWLAAAARPANAIRVQRPAIAQLDEPASDRTAGQASGAGDHADAATPGGRRLGRRETPASALVQHSIERLEAQANLRLVNHYKLHREL